MEGHRRDRAGLVVVSSPERLRRTGRPAGPGQGIKGKAMKRYVCDVCGYVYDPEVGDPDNGVAAGTAFENLPDDWVCPECGAEKDQFSPE